MKTEGGIHPSGSHVGDIGREGVRRDQVTNILTVDVEDWFQVENYSSFIPREDWPDCRLRVVDNVTRLLDLFAEVEVRATFFVLGWLAERLPGLVEKIVHAKHEVASHGWSHRPVWDLTRDEFADEVTRSRTLLEELSGQPVIGYRAPTYSITQDTLWALEILAASGYKYDSSIFPTYHDRYGIPTAALEIHRRAEGVWEIPLSVYQLGKIRLPVAGGGYLRLYPLRFTEMAIRRINGAGHPAVVYVHPWEIDPEQPRLQGVGLLRNIRHHIGIRHNHEKLAWLLHHLSFAPVHDHLVSLGALESPALHR